MARDRAGNRLRQARLTGLSSTPLVTNDFVGRTDREDIYRFQVSSSGQFRAELAGLARNSNVDLILYRVRGSLNAALRRIGNINFSNLRPRDINSALVQQGRSARPGRSNEIINRSLVAGEYVMRVTHRTGNTNYQLALSLTPGGSPVSPVPGVPSPTPTVPPTPTPTPTPSTPPLPPPPPPDAFTAQLGGSGNDFAYGVAASNSGKDIYTVGRTTGRLLSTASNGKSDAFIARYSDRGERVGLQQFGSGQDDALYAVAVDGSGTGFAVGTFNVVAPSVGAVAGLGDAYIVRFDSASNVQQQKQVDLGGIEAATSVALGDGTVIVGGSTIRVTDVPVLSASIGGFVSRFSSTENLMDVPLANNIVTDFANQPVTGVATDANGNIYVTAVSYTAIDPTPILSGSGDLDPSLLLQGEDIVVAKYTANGTRLWSTMLATNQDDYSRGVAVDAQGNVYIVGETRGSLPSGSLPANTNQGTLDAFIAKYSPSGVFQWSAQFGSPREDQAQGVSIAPGGTILVAGETFVGGDSQGFWARYSTNGERLFEQIIGTPVPDEANAVTATLTGHVYTAGQTQGNLSGTNQGNVDGWIAKSLLS